MKRLLTTLLLCVALSLTAGATETASEDAGLISGFNPLIDAGDLLSEEEEAAILSRIQDIHQAYDFDVTIFTMNDAPIGCSLGDYLHYFESLDPTRNGIVFGINMDVSNGGADRGQYTSTRNDAIEIFNQDALDTLNRILPEPLADGDYAEAIHLHLDYTTTFLELAQNGESYTGPLIANSVSWSMALIVGLLLAIIIVKVRFVAPMKTARKQTQAYDFMDEGSVQLRVKQDAYTHTTVKRTRRNEDNDEDDHNGGAHSDGYGGKRGGDGSGF